MDVRRIDTFGQVAAEDDALLEYFLTTSITKEIAGGKHFLVLGAKGAGKTALVRYFSERTHGDLLCRAIRLTDYPWCCGAGLMMGNRTASLMDIV